MFSGGIERDSRGSLFFVSKTEAALHRCSYKKSVLKIAAMEKTHAEVWFQSNFIEITLQHGCSPLNQLHYCRIFFSKNTPRELLLVTRTVKELKETRFNFTTPTSTRKSRCTKNEVFV